MRGGNAAWPKEQDRRSFCAGLTVECLACNEGAAASIQALPLSLAKPILAILAHEPEEAISFGPLYERANVSC